MSDQRTDLCDLETGVCEAPGISAEVGSHKAMKSNLEIIYIGDPMCSWCWGISSVVKQLQSYCDEQGLSFSVVVGGLRPGGGDPWNDQFKKFLRHHWEEINQRTGQAFSFSLFERSHFNYDTEPACRAVVTAGLLLNSTSDNNKTLYSLFADIQKKFYVDNADPGEEEFYRPLCDEYGLSFEEFRRVFRDPETKKRTFEEFQRNRSWGVRGYPSFGLLKDGKFELLATGFTDLEKIKARLR